MPDHWFLLTFGAVAASLLLWYLAAGRRQIQNAAAAAERLGFRPCREEKTWLEETVTAIENSSDFRYEVRDPLRWSKEPRVYTYGKIRHRDRHADVEPVVEQEILFPLKRSSGPVVVVVKSSSLAPGMVTRVIGAVATGPWDARPDDLQPLELPLDLQASNLVAALGPPGARFHDLVDANTTSVMRSLGDAGAIFVRVRNGWCSVASASSLIPFRLDEILARIRPVL